jgi:hypothetical protein
MASSSSNVLLPVPPENERVKLPLHLVEDVHACTGLAKAAACEWFAQGACRKGSKCKLRHEGDRSQLLTLPRVSFSRRDGKVVMSLRPPLDNGWKEFSKGQPKRVLAGGQQKLLKNGRSIIMYQTCCMAQGDKALQTECRQRGTAGELNATDKPFPDFMCHFCDLGPGLKMLKAGQVVPSDNYCGTGGISGHHIQAGPTLEAVAEIWAAASEGNSCAFVLGCNGCLVNGKWGRSIPAGAIAAREKNGKFFYAAHPSCIEIVAVAFDYDPLVQELVGFMGDDYSRDFHKALVACQTWLNDAKHSPNVETVEVLNPITMDGGRDVQERQAALKASQQRKPGHTASAGHKKPKKETQT